MNPHGVCSWCVMTLSEPFGRSAYQRTEDSFQWACQCAILEVWLRLRHTSDDCGPPFHFMRPRGTIMKQKPTKQNKTPNWRLPESWLTGLCYKKYYGFKLLNFRVTCYTDTDNNILQEFTVRLWTYSQRTCDIFFIWGFILIHIIKNIM